MAEARGQSSSTWNDAEAKVLPDTFKNLEVHDDGATEPARKRVVVVGLGMVGIAFM
jgi:nitrite reductase (NAD(P)H)